jgi:hypothetical protein
VADSNIMRGYIQTYLQQGYTREQISQGLLEQGYAERDIARAFREATGGAQEKPKLPASMIMFTLLALVIIGGGLLFVMNFEFPDNEPLPPPTRTETRLSDIIDNLIPLAADNPTAAVTLCNKVIEEDKDSCFKTVSSESRNPAVCEEISDARLRDACYLQYIYKGNKEFCDRLELPSNIEFCNTIRTLPETGKRHLV